MMIKQARGLKVEIINAQTGETTDITHAVIAWKVIGFRGIYAPRYYPVWNRFAREMSRPPRRSARRRHNRKLKRE